MPTDLLIARNRYPGPPLGEQSHLVRVDIEIMDSVLHVQ
jgi:hypothetical protein